MLCKAGDADITIVSPADLTPQPQFSARKYKAALQSKSLGQNLLVAASMPSTQTMLHQNFSKFPDGVICIVDTQTSGKGNSRIYWFAMTSPCVAATDDVLRLHSITYDMQGVAQIPGNHPSAV